MAKQGMNDHDRQIGVRIHDRRVVLGLTQQDFAQLIGITYQQVHKYERGINRVSAGRLWGIGEALGVGIDYFYTGMGDAPAAPSKHSRMRLEIGQELAKIDNPDHLVAISTMVRHLAAKGQ
jgi:transcriptional regulator with XRE-family HTH domain